MDLTAPLATTLPDEEIEALVRAAQRDRAAFSLLYDRYVRPVYRYHFNRVGNADDAQDLTAQTFLAALEALPRYRGRGLFAPWLFQIARSKSADFFRRRRPVVELEQAEGRSVHADLAAQVAQNEDTARLAALVANLEDDERELLRLRYVADLTFVEMAALLGKGDQAVKKSLYRLLARLQTQMES